MKRWLIGSLILLAAAATALAWSFSGAVLPVPAGAAFTLPTPRPPPELQLYAIASGSMASRAALAYRGGSFSDHRVFAMGSILIRHPQGDLLFDAGFGRSIAAHVRTTPRLMQWTSQYRAETPVADRLRATGIAPEHLRGVVLTHAHWDHVSGLEDLPGIPVWLHAAELAFIRSGDPSTELARQLGARDYRTLEFSDGAYLGFASSHDLFGDGSVVLVEAPGHTPGSIIAFVHLADGARYALIGDLAWQIEGVELPAERPWLPRRLVDHDAAAVRDLLVHLHRLQRELPGLVVVPAHDQRVWDRLPQLTPTP